MIEDALVPACIVERHADGSCTVFVPSAPTPAMGAIYILSAGRVYEVDVPLVQLAACVSKWGFWLWRAAGEGERRRADGVGLGRIELGRRATSGFDQTA